MKLKQDIPLPMLWESATSTHLIFTFVHSSALPAIHDFFTTKCIHVTIANHDQLIEEDESLLDKKITH